MARKYNVGTMIQAGEPETGEPWQRYNDPMNQSCLVISLCREIVSLNGTVGINIVMMGVRSNR